jgi:anti-sigma regulatory factor (Ser/Thr protein kinase)
MDRSIRPLTVPGNLDSLAAIKEYVMAAAKQADLDNKAAYKLRLAVDEIATNIIVYGYEEGKRPGVIDVRVDLNDLSLTIFLEDTAPAFNPTEKLSVETERVKQPIEERPIGGLGVYVAIDGVDRFFYERVNDRNCNVFVVNRT